jgi:Uma2 family endonuclease
MTTQELLAFPEDGIDRELIQGRLRERKFTLKGRQHAQTEANIAGLLCDWLKAQTKPRGEILSGECGFQIRMNPDTTVGIDVAYISPQTAGANSEGALLVDGPPVLAVEILSPSDTQEDIVDKVLAYLEGGVKLVWVVEPVFQTISIYRPDALPTMLNDTQELSGEAHLPGFRARVAEVFGG